MLPDQTHVRRGREETIVTSPGPAWRRWLSRRVPVKASPDQRTEHARAREQARAEGRRKDLTAKARERGCGL